MDDNNGFSYTYSAKEQAEIKHIREKYEKSVNGENGENGKENTMARLRSLDASVTGFAQTVAVIFGIVGVLILGFGMSLVMSELPAVLGIGIDATLPIGIAVGVLGCAVAALAYPLYGFVLRKKREKEAPEIIRLTDELMK